MFRSELGATGSYVVEKEVGSFSIIKPNGKKKLIPPIKYSLLKAYVITMSSSKSYYSGKVFEPHDFSLVDSETMTASLDGISLMGAIGMIVLVFCVLGIIFLNILRFRAGLPRYIPNPKDPASY